MKVLVGISGGVDSAFAARLLMEQGHTVCGCILEMHGHSDISSARIVASELGIPLVTLDLRERFSEVVVENFVREYLSGRTPNPCIICNERVKFAALCEYAEEHGFDRIATGHYAKIEWLQLDGRMKPCLRGADDKSKDQSYMLYRLPEKILEKTVFPLGSVTKSDVRGRTSELGLTVAGAKDSQEICFLPDGGYAEYIESVAGPSPHGAFVNENGDILGEHKGIIRYTVGQRKGLGISLGKRMFVTAVDPVSNTVVLGDEIKGKKEIFISDAVISDPTALKADSDARLAVKLRYTAPLKEASAQLLPDGRLRLIFDEAVKAAPGQSAVAYIGDRVVLGGIIN